MHTRLLFFLVVVVVLVSMGVLLVTASPSLYSDGGGARCEHEGRRYQNGEEWVKKIIFN